MDTSNPLINNLGLPHFAKIKAEHVVPAVDHMVKTSLKTLESIEEKVEPSWEKTLLALESLSRNISATFGPISHLTGVKTSEPLREAFREVQPKVIDLSLRISQSKPIYNAICKLKESEEFSELSSAKKRVIEQAIRNAKLSGIDLEEEKQKRYNEISKDLSKLATSFSNRVLDATKEYSLEITNKEDVASMPKSFYQMASQSWNTKNKDASQKSTPENGPYLVTLDVPCYMAFIQHCPTRELREKVYKAFVTRASSGKHDNNQAMEEILEKRKEKAQLLGFNTFAELSLSKKMADSVEAVDDLLGKLHHASIDAAKKEHATLQEFAEGLGHKGPLQNWDLPYYAERQREKLFDYSDDALRPYFPINRVLSGLFALVEKLFDIKVKERKEKVEVWHEDVAFFDIFDRDGSHLASFYLDPYSRPENKRGGAWMDTCIDRGYVGEEFFRPVAYLVCNGTPPVGDTPSLMTFREVETLFHEFGHGLQHMLTSVDVSAVAGINGVEWDAVELPSQFMENWCYHKPTLIGLTEHIETGEKLPSSIFEKIKASKNYRAAYAMLRQLHFGMVDMELHHRYDFSEDVHKVNQKIADKVLVLGLLEEDRLLCAFSHIFAGGYAAGYYSYKWAEVLSADAFSAFEEAGLDDEAATKAMGLKFRKTVLALGGSKDPASVFLTFRGRPQEVTALLRHSGLV